MIGRPLHKSAESVETFFTRVDLCSHGAKPEQKEAVCLMLQALDMLPCVIR